MIPDINLLPKLEKQRRVPLWLYIVLILLVSVVLAFFILQYFGAKSDLIKLTDQEQKLTKQREELQMKLSVAQGMNQGSLEQSVQFVENVSYPVTPLIDETDKLLPDYAYLRSYTFSEENVVIKVDFETMSSISEYVHKLLASPYFTDAQLASVSNFEVSFGDTKEVEGTDFNTIPRYTTDLTLSVNKSYLASTGGEE